MPFSFHQELLEAHRVWLKLSLLWSGPGILVCSTSRSTDSLPCTCAALRLRWECPALDSALSRNPSRKAHLEPRPHPGCSVSVRVAGISCSNSPDPSPKLYTLFLLGYSLKDGTLPGLHATPMPVEWPRGDYWQGCAWSSHMQADHVCTGGSLPCGREPELIRKEDRSQAWGQWKVLIWTWPSRSLWNYIHQGRELEQFYLGIFKPDLIILKYLDI